MSDRYDVYGGLATNNYGSAEPWSPLSAAMLERIADEQRTADLDSEERRLAEQAAK